MSTFLLVDDHSIILESLKSVINSMGYQVMGEATCGIEAVKQITMLKPQFVILDIGIPHLDGFEVLKRCPPSNERTYIIFSSLPHYLLKEQLDKIKVKAYISKQDDITVIKSKLTSFISSPVDSDGNDTGDKKNSQLCSLVHTLSAREIVVLKYLAQGYRNKEIAHVLMLSEKTVSTYKKRLMDTLGCTTLSSLILFVHRNNIL